MNPKQPDPKRPGPNLHQPLLDRNCCLGVVLIRTTSDPTKTIYGSTKTTSDATNTIYGTTKNLSGSTKTTSGSTKTTPETTSGIYKTSDEDGPAIFSDFVRRNSMCFWNGCLTRSVSSLEYKGCVVPATILVSGSEFALEVVRSAWARRVLRPPKGYTIGKLGDVGRLDLFPVPQTQFAPLSEAVCVAVCELNSASVVATSVTVRKRLCVEFPEMRLPSSSILHNTLGQLVKERKIYHTGEGYFVVSPDTYRQMSASPVCERQMLMTNEEAIVKMMHQGGGRRNTASTQVDAMEIEARRRDVSCQITQVPPSPDLQYLERSSSLKIFRSSNKPRAKAGDSLKENSGTEREVDRDSINEYQKTEKQSMLAKLLRRMQSLTEKSSGKHVSFSAQFPPLEWLDTAKFHCHSVATQTLIEKVGPTMSFKKLDTSSSKYQWPEDEKDVTRYFFSNGVPKSAFDNLASNSLPKNTNVPLRHGSTKYSPTHRYSHGPFTSHSKRRSKHRRSSSDSQKVPKNGYHSLSTGSKSPPDFSDAKISVSSSSGGYNLYPNSKPIVNPRLRNQDVFDSYPYKRHGTLPRAVERNTARDLFTYSPKLTSKQVYKPERLGDLNGIKALPKVSPHSPWKESYVASTLGSMKDDNNPPSNKNTFLELTKQNNVNNKKIEESSGIEGTKLPQAKQNNVNVGKIEDFSVLNDSKLGPASKPSNREIKESFLLGDAKQSSDNQNNINNKKIKESFLLGDAKLAPSESFSDSSISFNGKDHAKKETTQPELASIRPNLGIKPLVLKTFMESPKVEKKSPPKKEIVVDNSVSVEVAVENKSPSPTSKKNSNNVSTTIVTEETTVTNGKGNSKVVTTVTSITTSLSQGGIKDLDNVSSDDKKVSNEKDKTAEKNDLNMGSEKGSRIIDCTSSCNIVTEVK
ncbi:hypothetical protein JTE90_016561 [Oedothorax gibbosus]|uniref:Winged helix Storkhead-box1 domain-containing protein n=1 Tax=Oedothorax gibbosus TaxID=931172 RepID=A0AAV6UCA0_9ARAC|nr:hypothetical protein JTE90_016561 [Oedothorax gibbosus]